MTCGAASTLKLFDRGFQCRACRPLWHIPSNGRRCEEWVPICSLGRGDDHWQLFSHSKNYLNKSGPYKEIFPEVLEKSKNSFYTDYVYHITIMNPEQMSEIERIIDEIPEQTRFKQNGWVKVRETYQPEKCWISLEWKSY
jgi:hypothetical protein